METENHLEKGNICFAEGRFAEAEEHFSQALNEEGGQHGAMHGLALVAWMKGDLGCALESVQNALALMPESVSYLNSLGEIRRARGEWEEAEAALKQALEMNPAFAMAHNNLGMVYLSREDFPAAVTAFEHAVQLDPSLAMAYFNMGLAFKASNRLEEAIGAYSHAIALKPDFVYAHVNLAIALLLAGRLQEGFAEYEWRLKPEFTSPRHFEAPQWDGLIDPDKTLLVHTEQGHGDTLQFIRYLPFIAAQGMRVIVQCPAELQSLLESVEGVAMTYRIDEPLPDFDAHIPLLSLPHLFQTDLSKIPANVPYMVAPYEKVRAWGERLSAYGNTVKIGLRWMGNPQNTLDAERSFPLEMFTPLAGLPQVTFVSLQNTPLTAEERVSAEKLGMVDVSSDLRDFTDTAALIENLNLVIAVDTAVLHLACALGRPAWALLKHAPHWPWMLDREDSPWYPSLRLFRQRERGNWAEVLEEVAALLNGVMQSVQE